LRSDRLLSSATAWACWRAPADNPNAQAIQDELKDIDSQ
ncbi:hypothetical protein, partial [Klebsiella pneumoniae]